MSSAVGVATMIVIMVRGENDPIAARAAESVSGRDRLGTGPLIQVPRSAVNEGIVSYRRRAITNAQTMSPKIYGWTYRYCLQSG